MYLRAVRRQLRNCLASIEFVSFPFIQRKLLIPDNKQKRIKQMPQASGALRLLPGKQLLARAEAALQRAPGMPPLPLLQTRLLQLVRLPQRKYW